MVSLTEHEILDAQLPGPAASMARLLPFSRPDLALAILLPIVWSGNYRLAAEHQPFGIGKYSGSKIFYGFELRFWKEWRERTHSRRPKINT
ncbi:hypothetical protein D3C76_545990 [compost metagenome]